MDRTPVVSSNIAAVGWSDGTLEVEFASGDAWSYPGVPKSVYMALTTATSPGRTFAAMVRGQYQGTKVE